MTLRRSMIPSPPPALAAEVGSERERKRLLSSSRLRMAFTLFVVALLLSLSGLIFVLVSSIFDTLTPTIRADLEWKARRGAGELVHATELGIVVADEREIKGSLVGYDRDPDIMAIVVTDMTGKVLAQHGTAPEAATQLFSGPARSLRKTEGYYVSWAEAAIEGGPVGRVAVVVSTARLKAGDELKRKILVSAGAGAAVAFLFALLFVRLYIGPILRVTEDAFVKLEKTTAKALEAARLKSEFLANMSHEIRTPMNGVLGMIELLSRSRLDEKQQRYLGTLQTSAGGLMSVLNDILDFSKIEAGKMELREENCRVRALVDEVAELFAARAELKGVRIVTTVDPDVPSIVEADTERVRQVLSNLIGNAVKFTDHGTITVRAAVEEMRGAQLQLRFEVADTGMGIDAALQSKLFEAFSQVDGSLTRKHGGTGLGLAICRQLVVLMKGRIGVQSELGKGSTFWFVLPLRRLESTGSLELPSTLGSRPLAPPPSSHEGTRKILVAEDNAINREVMREVLAELGYEAHIVENGLQALTALEQESFPIVLLDCQMPELDGYGAAREVRRREPEGRHIPLIAVTAHAFEGEREKALAAGMDDYVTKPISGAALGEVITRWWPQTLSREPSPSDRAAPGDTSVVVPVADAEPPLLDPAVRRSEAVLRVFLKHVPDQIASIGQAIATGDEATLKSAAHKLKGGCLAVGVPRMAEVCGKLEDGQGEAEPLFAELERLFARAQSELSAQLAAKTKAASSAH